MKIVSFVILLFIITACTTSNTHQKNGIIKKDIFSNSENEFFLNNKILRGENQFVNLFFDWIEVDYNSFIKNSDKFLKDDNYFVSFWVFNKWVYLYRSRYITFEELLAKFNHSKNPFVKLNLDIIKDDYQKEYIDNSKKTLFNIPFFKYDGGYKYDLPYDFFHPKEKNKEFISKNMDFKNGKIYSPTRYNKDLVTHHFVTYFNTEDEKIDFYLIENEPIKILIDNKSVFLQDMNPYKREKNSIKEITFKKGVHKLDIYILSRRAEIYLSTNKKLKLIPLSKKITEKLSTITSIKDYKKILLEKSSKYKISNELKNIILFSIFRKISNYDIAYNYLTKLKYRNFFEDYLFYLYFWYNYNSEAENYLVSSLKKNKNFFDANYIITSQLKSLPYKKLEQLKKIVKKENFNYYYHLINIYNQIERKDEVIKNLHKLARLKNGLDFIYYRLRYIVKKYDLPLYERVDKDKIDKKLISKIDKNSNPIKKAWLINKILKNPYNPDYFNLLKYIKFDKSSYNMIMKKIGNHFIQQKESYEIENKDILGILDNENLSPRYFKAKLLEGDWKNYFNKTDSSNYGFEDTIKIIKDNMKNFKDILPTTTILDHDIVFITKFNNNIMINKTIKRVNNRMGIDKSSILYNNNYLSIRVIDGKTFKISNYNFDKYKKIVIKNLKDGDFIETITISMINYYPLTFSYKKRDINTLVAQADIYISKKADKIVLDYTNHFNKSKIIKLMSKNYIDYHYKEKNLKAYRTSNFLPNIKAYLPQIIIDKEIDIKKEYKKIQARYIRNSYYSLYAKKYFNQIKEIRSEKELKDLITDIVKKYKYKYQGSIDDILHTKAGNLFYFVHTILKFKKIKSEIIYLHSKTNIFSPKRANYYYITEMLKVYLKNKVYYLDLTSPFVTFKHIHPNFSGAESLRITNNADIIKERIPTKKDTTSLYNVNIKVEKETAFVKAKINILFQSGYRKYLLSLKSSKIKKMFSAYLSKEFGNIQDFNFKILNLDNRVDDFYIIFDFKKKLKLINNKINISSLVNGWNNMNYPLFSHYTYRETRDIPLNLSSMYSKIDIKISSNYKLNNIKNINLNSKFGSYKREIKFKDNLYNIILNYKIKTMIVTLKDYHLIKEFSQKISEMLNQDYFLK